MGSLGLRSLPKLEARKGKKNGTAVATGISAVGTGKAAAKAVSCLPSSSRMPVNYSQSKAAAKVRSSVGTDLSRKFN